MDEELESGEVDGNQNWRTDRLPLDFSNQPILGSQDLPMQPAEEYWQEYYIAETAIHLFKYQ
jgi:hypothetical protein